jgi:penicillin-binding protein A
MGRRIRWLGVVLILCFGLVIAQLTNIQFHRASALANSSDNPVNHVVNYDNQRGEIFAADGSVLAESVRVTPHTPGTYEWTRKYPTGPLFAQIVGVCNNAVEKVGCVTGVEGYYGSQLGLHKQSIQTLSQLLNPPPPTVDNITLTVNPTLQQDAYNLLAGLPGPNRDGAIVVLDPKTGAVLAMASQPTYDPAPIASPDATTAIAAFDQANTPDAEDYTPILPLAVNTPILPGSTAKVITTAAAYNLAPQIAATFNYPVSLCQPLPQSDKQICNDADTASEATPCGGTIPVMLPASCDPGYAELGLTLGATTLAQQADLFGINSRPPLDLAPENDVIGHVVQASVYPSAAAMSSGGNPGVPGQAYSAFGEQDVAITALQNAMIAAAVANGGAEMTPHLLAKVTDAQGRVVQTYEPTVWKQAMSAQAAAQIIPLMQAVVTSGTASGDGFPPSLDAAVKTGTAQVGTPTTSIADWMIGFAPANDPKVAVAVCVPKQGLNTYGATIAGPIMKAILEDAAALGL